MWGWCSKKREQWAPSGFSDSFTFYNDYGVEGKTLWDQKYEREEITGHTEKKVQQM